MMGTGAELALTLLFGLLDRSTQILALIAKAKAEGRDVSQAELDSLSQADDVARAELVIAIAKRRAQEAKTA
jgi:hypothetical protein